MVMHARSGGILEVMGLLLGKILFTCYIISVFVFFRSYLRFIFFLIGKVDANTMIVMDSFALPVEGTETRVNAQAQAYEYMTAYIEAAKQVGNILMITGILLTINL